MWHCKEHHFALCEVCLQAETFIEMMAANRHACLKAVKSRLIQGTLSEQASRSQFMEVVERFNEVEALKPQFQEAYQDIPGALQECEAARNFFKKEYNVHDQDIIVLQNQS